MKKIKQSLIKNIQFYIAIGTLFIGLVTAFVKLSLSAEDTKTKVHELKKEVKEVTDENDELEKKVEVNKAQQDNIQREVQQINDKTDKIVNILIDIQQKKK